MATEKVFFVTRRLQQKYREQHSHYSNPKPIHSRVPQGSVILLTLFSLFRKDISITNCLLCCHVADSTQHYSTSIDRRPPKGTPQIMTESHEALRFDLAIISEQDKRNLVCFIASKIYFYPLSTRHHLPYSYSQFFDDTAVSFNNSKHHLYVLH